MGGDTVIKRLLAVAAVLGLLLVCVAPGEVRAARQVPLTSGVSLPAGPYPLEPGQAALHDLVGVFSLSGGPAAAALDLAYQATMSFTAAGDGTVSAALPEELRSSAGTIVLEGLTVTAGGVPVTLANVAPPEHILEALPDGCQARKWRSFAIPLAAGGHVDVTIAYHVRIAAGRAAVRVNTAALGGWGGEVASAELRFGVPGFDPWNVTYLYPASLFRYSGQDEWTWDRTSFEPASDVLLSLDASSMELREDFIEADRQSGDRLAIWPMYERAREPLAAESPSGSQAVLVRYILARLSPEDLPALDEPMWRDVTAARETAGGWRVQATLIDPDADLTKWELCVSTGLGASRQILFSKVGQAEPMQLCGKTSVVETMALPRTGGMRLELTAWDAAGHKIAAEPLELTRDTLASPGFWWLAIAGLCGLAFWLRGRVRRTAEGRGSRQI